MSDDLRKRRIEGKNKAEKLRNEKKKKSKSWLWFFIFLFFIGGAVGSYFYYPELYNGENIVFSHNDGTDSLTPSDSAQDTELEEERKKALEEKKRKEKEKRELEEKAKELEEKAKELEEKEKELQRETQIPPQPSQPQVQPPQPSQPQVQPPQPSQPQVQPQLQPQTPQPGINDVTCMNKKIKQAEQKMGEVSTCGTLRNKCREKALQAAKVLYEGTSSCEYISAPGRIKIDTGLRDIKAKLYEHHEARGDNFCSQGRDDFAKKEYGKAKSYINDTNIQNKLRKSCP